MATRRESEGEEQQRLLSDEAMAVVGPAAASDVDPALALDAPNLWSDTSTSASEGEQQHDSGIDDDDEDDEFFIPADNNNTTTAKTTAPKRRGRRKKHELTPPPQIRNLLSHATGLYAAGDLQAAKEVVKEIIRLDGQSAQGYTLLSHIHEDMGNAKEAANALYMGASHASRDAAAWLHAARMARDIGFEQQALKCFDEAVKLDPRDMHVMYERSVMHAQYGKKRKAIDGFKKILRKHPMDMTVTRDLAKVYHAQGRTADAIELYANARTYYMLLPGVLKPDGDLDTPFDWNELNIYLGFLLESATGVECVRIIHVTSRWLRGRYSEAFWDAYQDDSREWDKDDSRRSEVASYIAGAWDPSRYTLPIEIRVRLGIAWLLSKNFAEAMIQFGFLQEFDVENYADLYWDVAEALEAHAHPSEALQFYTIINAQDQYNAPNTWAALGRCYALLGDLQQAEECFNMCAKENPRDFETRLNLAEILEKTNRKDGALEMVEAVRREKYELIRNPPAMEEPVPTSGALIPNERKRIGQPIPSLPRRFGAISGTPRTGSPVPRPPRTQRTADRTLVDANRQEAVLEKWASLEQLRAKMEDGREDDVQSWLTIAQELIEEFKSVKGFFPWERGKRIARFDEDGVGRIKKKRKLSELETKLEELSTSLVDQGPDTSQAGDQEVMGSVAPLESSEPRDFSKESFRGLEFEQWFYIFMQVQTSRRYGTIEEADSIVEVALDANIFYQTSRFQLMTPLVQLAYSFHHASIPDISAQIRKLISAYKFRSDPLRLYYLALGTGREGVEQFRAAVDQRFLLRHIKAMDSLLTGEDIAGRATVTNEDEKRSRANPILLILYGHRLAAGASFLPAQSSSFLCLAADGAIVYYFRARELVKDDPLLEFSIGLAYLHRAMQRQANNRQLLILEGMTFLFRYRQLYIAKSHRYDGTAGAAMRQAAEYNIARAFQQLGLFTLSMRYYERAIGVSEEFEGGLGTRDLRRECAHNLSLIFALSGNMAGVKAVTEKYFVL